MIPTQNHWLIGVLLVFGALLISLFAIVSARPENGSKPSRALQIPVEFNAQAEEWLSAAATPGRIAISIRGPAGHASDANARGPATDDIAETINTYGCLPPEEHSRIEASLRESIIDLTRTAEGTADTLGDSLADYADLLDQWRTIECYKAALNQFSKGRYITTDIRFLTKSFPTPRGYSIFRRNSTVLDAVGKKKSVAVVIPFRTADYTALEEFERSHEDVVRAAVLEWAAQFNSLSDADRAERIRLNDEVHELLRHSSRPDEDVRRKIRDGLIPVALAIDRRTLTVHLR